MRKQDISHLWGKRVHVEDILVDGIVRVSSDNRNDLYIFPSDGIEWDGMYDSHYQFQEKMQVSRSGRQVLCMHEDLSEDNKTRGLCGAEVKIMNISEYSLGLNIIRLELSLNIDEKPDVKIWLISEIDEDGRELDIEVESLYHDNLYDIRVVEDISISPGMPTLMRKQLEFFSWERSIPKESYAIHKQAKNMNETGSNLSLGTRLTVLSKRLGRKRCCDATPDRCLEVCRLTIFASHCKKCFVFFKRSRGLVGSRGLKRTK